MENKNTSPGKKGGKWKIVAGALVIVAVVATVVLGAQGGLFQGLSKKDKNPKPVKNPYAQTETLEMAIDDVYNEAYGIPAPEETPQYIDKGDYGKLIIEASGTDTIIDIDFKAEENITRAEAATWLYQAFDVQATSPKALLYSDVSLDVWYGEYVTILGGYDVFMEEYDRNGDLFFRPSDSLTIVEAGYWIDNAKIANFGTELEAIKFDVENTTR